jgi:hypothetical protein
VLPLRNDLDGVSDIRAEYHGHGKARLTVSGLNALLLANFTSRGTLVPANAIVCRCADRERRRRRKVAGGIAHTERSSLTKALVRLIDVLAKMTRLLAAADRVIRCGLSRWHCGVGWLFRNDGRRTTRRLGRPLGA